jgi:hypothetical protein
MLTSVTIPYILIYYTDMSYILMYSELIYLNILVK